MTILNNTVAGDQNDTAQETKNVVKHGPIYLAGNLIHRAAGIVLIPLYTHHLLPAEYGVYALLVSVMDMLTILLGCGLASAMNRFYFDVKNEYQRLQLISTVFICLLILSVLIGLSAYPLGWVIVRFMFDSAEYAGLFALAIATLIFTLLFEVQMNYAVVRKRPQIFLGLAVAKAVLLLALNLVWVGYAHMGLWGVVGSMLVTFALITLLYLVCIFWQVGWHWSPTLVKQLFIYGMPLVPSAFANASMTFIERYCLNHWAGAAVVGVYALAFRLASLLQMFIATPFSQVFFVRRFETLARGEPQSGLDSLLLVFVAVMSLAVLALALFSQEILQLIAPNSYAGVAPLLPLLGVCFVLSSINQNYELGIMYQKKTYYIALIGGISLAATVVLNIILVPMFAVWGALLALLAVNIIRLVATLRVNRLCAAALIHLDLKRAVVMLMVALLVAVLTHELTATLSLVFRLLIKSMSWLAVAVVLLFSTIMDPSIAKAARKLVKSCVQKALMSMATSLK